ncbi:hypothetical protein CHS0354_009724 [Potamilus streckersoni]|uniref:Mitochondria-eating protein C-terminal domain-containing protein n=1 Tax=Potamilus streckersoni TaxID=2493646 RepID=A0AAE0VN30_9BIVA|nr:hypothetical protein CHS0354_009724 [Potamilus streckersoni]
MSSKKSERGAGSDISNKDETSHSYLSSHSRTTVRQSSSAKAKNNKNAAALKVSDPRPQTGYSRVKPTHPSRPKSADTRLARGNLKGETPAEESTKILEGETKKGALKNEKSEWEREMVYLQNRLEEEKQKVKETENKIEYIKEKNKNELERMSKIVQEREESLSKAEEEKKILEKDYNHLQQDMERELYKNTEWKNILESMTEKHTKEKEKLSDTIECLKAEKDNLMTRLSSAAAYRLTHENVNITDLSDADRPTKLQEVYSELYDNEWTDAFQELTEHQKIPDKDAIMILLEILTISFHNCREITWGRYERIINVTSSIDIEQRNSLSPAEKNSPIDNNLDTMQEETVSSECGEKKGNHYSTDEKVDPSNEQVKESSKDKIRNEMIAAKYNSVDNKDKAGEQIEGVGNEDLQHSTDEKVDPSDEKNAAKYNSVDNKDKAGEPIEGVGNEDLQNGTKEKMASVDPNVNGSSKDKSANVKGKNGAKEKVESGDPNVNGALKEISENAKELNGSKENVDSADPNVIETSKDKSENKTGKSGAKENFKYDDPNVNEETEIQNGKRLKFTINLSFDLVHEIKGIWRKTCAELKGSLSEQIYAVIETCLDMPFSALPMTSEYLKRCIDLCWKMGVQERPLHLDSISELDACVGKKFNNDKFRGYTQSGKIVAFVVWPSLYLYEGGPVLVKGIAQGCTGDKKR